jgi:hypothetical protein
VRPCQVESSVRRASPGCGVFWLVVGADETYQGADRVDDCVPAGSNVRRACFCPGFTGGAPGPLPRDSTSDSNGRDGPLVAPS